MKYPYWVKIDMGSDHDIVKCAESPLDHDELKYQGPFETLAEARQFIRNVSQADIDDIRNRVNYWVSIPASKIRLVDTDLKDTESKPIISVEVWRYYIRLKDEMFDTIEEAAITAAKACDSNTECYGPAKNIETDETWDQSTLLDLGWGYLKTLDDNYLHRRALNE